MNRLYPWRHIARPALVWLLGVAMPVLAQPLRDPTVPPAAAAPYAPSAMGDAARTLTVQPGAVALLVREGVPYLVVGTRLYGKGQNVGPARIERISETEVWLRENGVLRKVPVFGGIERRTSAAQISVQKSTGSASLAAPKNH